MVIPLTQSKCGIVLAYKDGADVYMDEEADYFDDILDCFDKLIWERIAEGLHRHDAAKRS